MNDQAPSSERQPTDDDVVIDITDAALAKQALYERLVSASPNGELILDLRDEVLEEIAMLAPTGRTISHLDQPSGRPPDLQEGLELVIIEDGPEWAQAEAFVYDCYVKLGYTDENREHQVAELARYRDRSRFHAAVNQKGDIVGTTRAIFGEYHELPVGRFTRFDFEDEDPMCELSSIVVEPGSRNQGVIEHLYRQGWADGLRSGARAIAGLGEKWMIDGFRNYYGMPFVPCGIPEWYMGGKVIPMTMTTGVAAMVEAHRVNPEFYWWNIEILTDEEIDRIGCRHLTREASTAAPR